VEVDVDVDVDVEVEVEVDVEVCGTERNGILCLRRTETGME